MKKRLPLIVTVALSALMAAVCYGCMLPDVLWKHYQRNLFMGDAQYLREHLLRPAGLVAYAGRWLAEWLATPATAAVAAALAFGLLALCIAWAFRLRGAVASLVLLVAAALLASTAQMGYMVYVFKVAAPAFTPLLGVLVATLLYGASTRIRSSWLAGATTLASVLLGYAMAGGYVLLYIYIIGIYAILLLLRKEMLRAIAVLAGLACGALMLDTMAPMLYVSVNPDTLWSIGQPDFLHTDEEQPLWYPLWTAYGVQIFLAASREWLEKLQQWLNAVVQYVVLVLVAALSAYGLHARTFSDPDLPATLRAEQAMEQGDWQRVINEINAVPGEPTRAMVLLRGLALCRTGQSLEQYFTFADGSRPYRCPRQAQMLRLMLSRPLYFHYGKINYCYRWAMEDKVEYGLSHELLDYFIRCSLLNGEWALAQKYIATLRRVPGSQAQADCYASLIEQAQKIVADPAFAHTLPLMAYNNALDGDGGLVEVYLLRNFGLMNGGGAELVELSLLANLIEKDAEMFWHHLLVYARHHDALPRHLQEAALMWGQLQGVDVSSLRIDPDVQSAFAQLVERASSLSDEQAANDPMLRAQFGQTYWYYYFFVKNLKTN